MKQEENILFLFFSKIKEEDEAKVRRNAGVYPVAGRFCFKVINCLLFRLWSEPNLCIINLKLTV
jgi:hypothetical protein